MGSAGWDEVLGGGGAGDEPDGVGPSDDDDGEGPRKKRVKTSTKVVLVVAGWLLLTLFLVGKFSADKPQPSAVARLDTVAGADGGGDGGVEEEFEPEPVDTEEEELLDADGDGFLSAAELGITEGEAAASVEGGSDGAGSGSSSSGAYSGTPTGDGGSGSSGNAVPGTAPGGGSTGGGSTGGGTTGGGTSGSTTTTSGGSDGASTTTTKPGSPSTTSTTRPPSSTTSSTTTSTSTSIASGPEATITITDPATNIGSPGVFNPGNLLIASGTRVRVENQDSKAHGWDLEEYGEVGIEAGKSSAYVTITGPSGKTFDYKCSVHASMKGKITIQ